LRNENFSTLNNRPTNILTTPYSNFCKEYEKSVKTRKHKHRASYFSQQYAAEDINRGIKDKEGMRMRKGAGRLFARVIEVFKEKGICYVVRATIKTIVYWSTELFRYYYYKIFRSSRTFTFQGETYNYFYHMYNMTWKNERAVELPIIWEIVKKYSGKRILEVGNVLSHYFYVNHDILDKYDKARGVINQDVVDFHPSKKYDLIVSISTLEHVGWDEKPREPTKILRATENLKNLIASGGKIVVTLPLGYNNLLDKLLKEGRIPFTKCYFLKRILGDNRWIEVEEDDVHEAKYFGPFLGTSGLVIGIID